MILVTGGLGMIGAHTARALVDLGHEVVVTAHHRAEVPSFLIGRVTVEALDVTDRDGFLALAGRHTISDIVHLAGSIPGHDPVRFLRTETTGLLNALDAARSWGVRRFAVASSLGVYSGRGEIPWHEDLALPASSLPHLIVAFKKAAEPLTTHGLQAAASSRSCSGSGPSGGRSATRSRRSSLSLLHQRGAPRRAAAAALRRGRR